jgi:hypothetical protein
LGGDPIGTCQQVCRAAEGIDAGHEEYQCNAESGWLQGESVSHAYAYNGGHNGSHIYADNGSHNGSHVYADTGSHNGSHDYVDTGSHANNRASE